MGKIILFLLGAAIAGSLYYHLNKEDAPNADGDSSLPDISSLESLPSIEMGPVSSDALSEKAKKILADAKKEWNSLSAEGKTPELSSRAPSLSKKISTVLRETYNKPALKALQIQLLSNYLTPLGEKLFYSTTMYEKDKLGFFSAYTIKSGDLLDKIGRKYGMSRHMLNIMRGKDAEDGIYGVGDRIKVFNAKKEGFNEYFMHIDKSDYFLDVFVGGLFSCRYDIGIGKEGHETPVGTTFVETREKGSQGVPWTDPVTGIQYDADDPRNILGSYWMRFNSKIGRSGLGFHTYTGEGPIVRAKVSNGCIRLMPKDVAKLYNTLVPISGSVAKGNFLSRVPMNIEIVE